MYNICKNNIISIKKRKFLTNWILWHWWTFKVKVLNIEYILTLKNWNFTLSFEEFIIDWIHTIEDIKKDKKEIQRHMYFQTPFNYNPYSTDVYRLINWPALY